MTEPVRSASDIAADEMQRPNEISTEQHREPRAVDTGYVEEHSDRDADSDPLIEKHPEPSQAVSGAAPKEKTSKEVGFYFLTRKKDQNSSACQLCGTSYGLFTHRHHCRICGKCLCWECTPLAVEGVYPDGKLATRADPAKCCKACYFSPKLAPFTLSNTPYLVEVRNGSKVVDGTVVGCAILTVTNPDDGKLILSREFSLSVLCYGEGASTEATSKVILVGLEDKSVTKIGVSLAAH